MGEAVISTIRRRCPERADARPMAGLTPLARGAVLGMLLAACAATSAWAASSTEQSSSILIFPKVVFDGTRDTFIQISNTANSMVHAHCFYVNAAPLCIGAGDCLAGTCTGTCQPQWVEVDFSIWLTKQQPTHWGVGSGRFPDPSIVPCDPKNSECDGAGLDPGRVPPANSVPFLGELRCIEVDQSGAPISGNHLKGEATIVSTDGDASRYNAVGLLGEPFSNDGDGVLCLGGGVTDQCRSGAEYEGCGDHAFLDHFAEDADDPLFGPTSRVDTEVTLVPCQADYEHQNPARITVNFTVFDEFELRFSAATVVDCWRSFFLDDVNSIFRISTLQTRLAVTRMQSSSGSDSGFVGVAEEYHRLRDRQARVAFNLHEQGTRQQTDLIFVPEGP